MKFNESSQLHELRWNLWLPRVSIGLAAAGILCGATLQAAEEKAAERTQAAERADEQVTGTSESQKAKPKLSFTDEDLKKYQAPKADADEDAAVLEGLEEEGKGTRPPAPQGAPLVRTPVNIAPSPADDPLKEYKDRQAREKFRAARIETLRQQIGGLEKRLAHLNEKRLAIIDPLRIMPQPQGSDDIAAEEGLGSAELLATVEEEIESTEASLESARENLVALQTRFGTEAR